MRLKKHHVRFVRNSTASLILTCQTLLVALVVVFSTPGLVCFVFVGWPGGGGVLKVFALACCP